MHLKEIIKEDVMTSESNKSENLVNIKFSVLDEERRIVYGIVYTPDMLDSRMGYSNQEEIESLAYRFMQLTLAQVVDTQHNNEPNGSFPVESFVAREGDPDFPAGSWVVATKVVDDALWQEVLAGNYNGYSVEMMTRRRLHEVTLASHPTLVGETEPTNEHSHTYYLEINSKGDIIRGNTSEDNGHSHEIVRNSVTSVYDNHSHRIIIQNK